MCVYIYIYMDIYVYIYIYIYRWPCILYISVPAPSLDSMWVVESPHCKTTSLVTWPANPFGLVSINRLVTSN